MFQILCLDKEVMPIDNKSLKKCLVMSFGLNNDLTFDMASLDLTCDVHMFDYLFTSYPILKDEKHAFFHQVCN